MKLPHILILVVLALGAGFLPGKTVRSQDAKSTRITIRFASLVPRS